MIKNQCQYEVTKSQAAKFADALQRAETRQGIEPLLRQLETDALRSQLEELNSEIKKYEESQNAGNSKAAPASLQELPNVLINARIAAGLTQRELADRAGLKEEQIQKYESTGYANASLSRINQVAAALHVKVYCVT